MKKVFLTLIMAVGMVAVANANENKRDLIKVKEATCKQFASTSKVIMEAHQVGVPMSEMLALVQRYSVEPNGTTPWDIFLKESVIKAYSSPRYNSEKVQQSAIADFRDKRHIDCLELINQ